MAIRRGLFGRFILSIVNLKIDRQMRGVRCFMTQTAEIKILERMIQQGGRAQGVTNENDTLSWLARQGEARLALLLSLQLRSRPAEPLIELKLTR